MLLKHAVEEAVKTTHVYPGGDGRGVIVVAGGRYLPAAYVMIRHLRATGCRLPVQLWHLGAAEIPPFWKPLTSGLDITMVDGLAAPGAADFVRLGAWECKIHAVVACTFDSVLLIDADNIPLTDPLFLFDSVPFREYGQIFWPDFDLPAQSQYAIQQAAWETFALPVKNGLELETGQVLIDRRACWHELQVVKQFNAHSNECYGQLTWGDKDTFTLAWLLTKKPYYVVPIRPRHIQPDAGTLAWQHWIDGRRLFQHQRKWFYPPDVMASRLHPGELLREQSLAYHQCFYDAAYESAGLRCPTD
jgi:hypothetical protein